jgi:SAM-dependent methyltransferase
MTSRTRRVLISVATHCEVGAIDPLVRDIGEHLPDADLLVIDDASTDGTSELLDRLASEQRGMTVIHRPSRLGVGSAHKLALLFARQHGYDALLTLACDAPSTSAAVALPRLLAALESADFVTVGAAPPPTRLAGRFVRAAMTLAIGRDASEHSPLLRGYGRVVLEGLDVSAIRSDGPAFAFESLAGIAAVTTRWTALGLSGATPSDLETPRGALAGLARVVASRVRPGTRPRADETPVECRVCGGGYHVEFHPPREDGGRARRDVSPYSCASHSGRTHGQILRCLTCGMIFMRPRLSSEALVAEYEKVIDPVYLDNMPARFETFRRTLGRIAPILGSPAKVLEVGSYCGAFLRIARERGIDIVGIEPSAWAAEQASRWTDAPVYQGTLDDVPPDLGPFDAVVAWDVVEHFADPVAELQKINRLMPIGGRLFFCTLMVDNWFPRLVGSYWPWFMDMHLFYFDASTIREVLRRSGFVLVDATPYRHITTVEYLLRKLGTLGIPGARQASRLAAQTPWGKRQIPVRLGDIQLFSCTKVAEVPTAPARHAARAAAHPQSLGRTTLH